MLWIGYCPACGLHPTLAGQTALFQRPHIGFRLPPCRAVLQRAIARDHDVFGLGQQQLFLHLRRVAAADVGMRAGERDFLMLGCNAVEGEVPATLVSGA
ncbi:hypothetical protein D9M70_503780 [compost metagenome]